MAPETLFIFLGTASALWLAARAHEARKGNGRGSLFRALPGVDRAVFLILAAALCLRAVPKPVPPSGAPAPAAQRRGPPAGSPPPPAASPSGGAAPGALTPAQYAAGFALTRVSTNPAAWLAAPSNAVVHAPWAVYGVAEDIFWLQTNGWSFTLGTNRVEGLYVSSSGLVSFRDPLSTPKPSSVPENASLLAPLHGSFGTVPPQGRFWHAVTASNSLLLTWENLYAGRETNSPVSFQSELFKNGDFVYRYAFTDAPALTNFFIGARHNHGGETFAPGDPSAPAGGLELRWRAFGMLDPSVSDHDGDGIPTYDELFIHGTDPSMADTDLDGLSDGAEIALGSCPLTRDTDGDGIPDGADPDPLNATPADDLDGDGLPDAWENHWFGSTNATDGAGADTDGDGFSDRAGLLTGTDPAFAACAASSSHGAHAFAWTALPGATNYAVCVSRGGAAVWSCATNANALSASGDFSSAVHTLTVTAHRDGAGPRAASVSFRQPSRPNLTVWKIADPFALEAPPGLTNVLCRTFPAARDGGWQQYFVSSGHDSAGAWSLEGLRLEWSDSCGASGSASASPPGDSLRLALSPDGPGTLTVRIVPDGSGGAARSPKPLYLLRWSPAVAFSPTGTVSAVTGDGAVAAAVSDRGGGPGPASFTVDRSGRPHNAPPGPDELARQSSPFAPGSGASFEGAHGADGALSGGTVLSGAPGLFGLPGGGL
ncbi:MAG TPA: hypothetical protein PLH01_02770, partial [Kiritimatiellia bacterium]|nr:hypothetical protein [Kiritimatiellia bacterium]